MVEQQDELALQAVDPSLGLSRRGLILSLVSMVAVGLLVYSFFPASVGGPSLPVEVSLDYRMVESMGGQGPVATEVVVVRNLESFEIPRLSIEINGQYLLFRDSPLAALEELVLPQQVFTDKRSSQRFNPRKYEVEDIVVTGQLPSGSRGVIKVDFVES